MLKEKYLFYKVKYEEYVLLIKSGNFYVSLNKDAIVINNLLKYKIIESTNFIKIGFPSSSLNKVLKILENQKINYLIIEDEIINKQKYKTNNYSKYIDNFEIYLTKINNINKILKNNLNNKRIKEIIENIENIVCQINY